MRQIFQHVNRPVNGPITTIQIRKDGIIEVSVQSQRKLDPSDIIHLVSDLYRLDPNGENTKILIKSDTSDPLTREARFFLSNCSSIRAAALVVSQKVRKFWKTPKYLKEKRSGVCALKDFSSPELGERWLESH